MRITQKLESALYRCGVLVMPQRNATELWYGVEQIHVQVWKITSLWIVGIFR